MPLLQATCPTRDAAHSFWSQEKRQPGDKRNKISFSLKGRRCHRLFFVYFRYRLPFAPCSSFSFDYHLTSKIIYSHSSVRPISGKITIRKRGRYPGTKKAKVRPGFVPSCKIKHPSLSRNAVCFIAFSVNHFSWGISFARSRNYR